MPSYHPCLYCSEWLECECQFLDGGWKISHKRRGERCRCCVVAIQVRSRFCSHFARVLLPFVLLKKHVARPSSPSIARKSDFCPKKDVKWRDLSLKPPTCGFRFKKETRWHDLPAKLFTHRFRS